MRTPSRSVWLQRGAIGADVADATLGIDGDAQGGGEVRGRIEARGGDRHRQAGQATAGPAEVVAFDDDLLTGRRRHRHGGDRVGDGMQPIPADVGDRAAHPHRIDPRGGRIRSDDDRDIVATPMGIDDMGEKEGPALVFRNAAQELAAHQRVQFSVLVDRMVDPNQQPLRFQCGNMGLEIKAWGRDLRRPRITHFGYDPPQHPVAGLCPTKGAPIGSPTRGPAPLRVQGRAMRYIPNATYYAVSAMHIPSVQERECRARLSFAGLLRCGGRPAGLLCVRIFRI